MTTAPIPGQWPSAVLIPARSGRAGFALARLIDRIYNTASEPGVGRRVPRPLCFSNTRRINLARRSILSKAFANLDGLLVVQGSKGETILGTEIRWEDSWLSRWRGPDGRAERSRLAWRQQGLNRNLLVASRGPLRESPPCQPGPDLRGYIYLALMVLFGSTTSPFAMVAVRELPVGILPLLRFSFAGLCLIPFLSDRSALSHSCEDTRRLVLVAAFCVPINQSFFLNATRFGPNSHVGLFYAVCPLVVWGLAWMLGHENLDLRRLWGVLASIAGVAVIGLGNLWQGSGGSPAESHSIMVADLLLVGAVLSWGAYLTLSKPLVARHGACRFWPEPSSSAVCSNCRLPWSRCPAGCPCSVEPPRPPGPAWRSWRFWSPRSIWLCKTCRFAASTPARSRPSATRPPC